MSIFANVYELENIFELLVLWEILAGLGIELFDHFVKLFEVHVSTSGIVPLYR